MVGFRFQSPGVAVSHVCRHVGSLKHITSSRGPEVRCWMRGMVCVLR